jgi:hypothetical protein
MRYVEYRDLIHNELRHAPGGCTWADLRDRLDLPYDRPCPTWTQQLEKDIGLCRVKGPGRSLIWSVNPRRNV